MSDDLFDGLMEEGGGFGGFGALKDDIVLLKDEAQEIMREIEEVKTLAISLMERQARVMDAIGRIKDAASF